MAIKVLIGLFIAGPTKSNHHNATDLFTNGMSMAIYRLTISLERYKFLLWNIGFNNKPMRDDSVKFDKMTTHYMGILWQFYVTLSK